MLTGLVIIAVILQVTIAMATYLRRRNNSSSFVFMLLNFVLAGWALASYVSTVLDYDSSSIVVIRIVIGLVILQNTLFYLFTHLFPRGSIKDLTLRNKTILGLSLMLAVISQTPLLFSSASLTENGVSPNPGPLIPFFLLHAVVTIGGGLRQLIHKHKQARAQYKKQLLIILIASIILWIVVPITNFVVPVIAQTDVFVKLSPFYTFAFSLLLTYGIVQLKLFDIRLVIARSLGYILSLALLVVIYSVIAQFVVQLLEAFDSYLITIVRNTMLVVFVVLTYQPLKEFFDKQTNRIFYRDAYDPQRFLDQLNDTIVGNIEIGILLRHTTSVIADNLKADCHVFLHETPTAPARLIGNTRKDIKEKHLKVIQTELSTIKDSIVSSDELEDHYLELKNTLYINDIAVVSKLTTSYSGNQEASAYLLLGPKKNGGSFSKQDIRIIGIIADELLIAIQNALRFEEIQNFNVTLQKSINEATAKLKRSNEKLKEMDETKDEFISMASHQLRTPLTSVKGYLSMVLEGDAGKVTDTQKQLLNQAYVSSQRMVYLIADLLNVSRLKTGKFVIDKSPTNLADMVESEISQLVEVAKSRKLTLSFNKPKDFPVLELDETKTRQVVMNFVDNAIYYTPAGGKIKIELRTDRSSVYFMVKDNGIGVPKSEQSHLFDKFFRAENAQKARPDGTGLGLFMAKKVITEQGGNILFDSVEGKGSTFGFKFDRPKEKSV